MSIAKDIQQLVAEIDELEADKKRVGPTHQEAELDKLIADKVRKIDVLRKEGGLNV